MDDESNSSLVLVPLETEIFTDAANKYKHGLEQAAKSLAERVIMSTVLKMSDNACHSIATFRDSELGLGPLLGKGGFCNVYEIGSIKLSPKVPAQESSDHSLEKGGTDFCTNQSFTERDTEENVVNTEDDNFIWSRNLMEKYALRGKSARYAVKQIKSELLSIHDPLEREQMFIHATTDLAVEARYLSVLSHPNIIKMRGLSSGDPFSGSYFIILDRLFGTLGERINEWKMMQPELAPKLFDKLFCRSMNNLYDKEVWADQLKAAYGLSSALKHIHSRGIIYRDLKPDNIGFDVRDDIKIFDFGLSTEMFSHLKAEDGLYHLTGYVGTLRYMAPEVYFGEPYNISADVFSFGTVLWQLFSLELPFRRLSMEGFEKKVMGKALIPRKVEWWPNCEQIYKTMKSCWDRDPLSRPAMGDISKEISLMIAQHSGEDAGAIQFRLESRRSRKSMMDLRLSGTSKRSTDSSRYSEKGSASSFLSMRSSRNNFKFTS